MTEMSGIKYQLLILDRETHTKDTLKGVLDDSEFQMDYECSATVGFKKIQKRHYDLIVSEIHLGGDEMTGLEILQKVRESNSAVPFIIVSDRASVESSVKAINYGVSGYLVKPLIPAEASEAIKRSIRHHKGRFLKNQLENYVMENAFQAVITSEEKSILKLLDTVDNLIELVYPKDHGGFSDLKMAIYEGLSNAVEHGNRHQPDRNVYFKLNLKMDKITVHIRDEGNGFDSKTAGKEANGLKGLHRGLHLIHHLMDEVSFNTKGNEINLLKILQ